MSILSILEFPDARLRQKAKPVTQVDASIHAMLDDMLETMYQENGVGLAATQVDIHLRMIVIDVSESRKEPLYVINPEIIHREGIQYETEGCLSFPTVYEYVERAATVRLRALNRAGESFEIDAEGLLATCIQHEMDHLEGVLFIDHLSRLKQERARKKLDKTRRRVS